MDYVTGIKASISHKTCKTQILTDFMCILPHVDYGSPEQRKAAIAYFMQRGYSWLR